MEKQLLNIEDAKKVILKNYDIVDDSEIALIGRWKFSDFIKENNNLKDNFVNILYSFDFEVVYTTNYHYAFHNSTYITIHQLNYGVNMPDISNEGDIYERLEERIEFDDSNFNNENEKIELMELFYKIIDLFYLASDEIIREESKC